MFLARRVCAQTPAAVLRRAYSASTLPSMETIRGLQKEREAQIEEAELEVAKLGFPQQGIFRQELIWGDHDQFQHVNNVHYIRWLESARMHWVKLLASSLPPQMYDDLRLGRNVGVILATNFCRYRRPLLYPDTVLIGQSVKWPLERDDRFTVKSAIYSVNQRAVVAEAENDTVTYDYNQLRKAPIPPELRAALEAWQYRGK